jgi:hypothetical protein
VNRPGLSSGGNLRRRMRRDASSLSQGNTAAPEPHDPVEIHADP